VAVTVPQQLGATISRTSAAQLRNLQNFVNGRNFVGSLVNSAPRDVRVHRKSRTRLTISELGDRAGSIVGVIDGSV
jgi:hypothetical protein